ncbi:MAG: hypothetical protein GXY62_07000 [Thermotogaceae bacterium]|jgi:hypothetical protein|nr:hypothetical protein [Mesotoga sp.]NLX34059.1 hypothetical protein [Thermotogaceae bacterium]MDD4039688.1 DUF6305 family protein [Mesotoga sp.]MDD4479797.1 DUF6305 family protein [Mesotoga sp.]HPX21487.1 DUF6305 family protein [Mesotoga sp.]
MKKTLVVLLALLILSTTMVFALVTGSPVIKGQLPFLLTNAGQGPGGKMARLLIWQSKAIQETDFDYNAEPLRDNPNDLAARDYKMLFVIIGSSAKGLGASGITIEEEIARLNKMIVEAQKLDLFIIAAHIEGKDRRGNPGSADEQSIDAIAPFADYLIVMKDGNQDGKFTRIAQEKNIPLTIIDNTIDFMQVIKQMFPTE